MSEAENDEAMGRHTARAAQVRALSMSMPCLRTDAPMHRF